MAFWEESLPNGSWRGVGPPSRTALLITSHLNSKDDLSCGHPERVGEHVSTVLRMVAGQDILQRVEGRV